MLDQFERFDMKAHPKRPKLRLLSYLIAIFPVKSHKAKIKKNKHGRNQTSIPFIRQP